LNIAPEALVLSFSQSDLEAERRLADRRRGAIDRSETFWKLFAQKSASAIGYAAGA
jgi:hypothetical protein